MSTDRPKPPPTEQCDNMERLDSRGESYRFACWHPQLGGYVGKCTVEFDIEPGSTELACFDVRHWHDGEFPSDNSYRDLHYCNPKQLVDFGLLVIEKQIEHLRPLGPKSSFRASPDEEWVRQTIEQLQKMITRPPRPGTPAYPAGTRYGLIKRENLKWSKS